MLWSMVYLVVCRQQAKRPLGAMSMIYSRPAA
jgi:hypothetical protein